MRNVLKPTKDAAPQSGTIKPEWLRVADVRAVFGIGKTRLYELIADGKVVSKNLHQRNARRGLRLISFDSVAKLIEEAQP